MYFLGLNRTCGVQDTTSISQKLPLAPVGLPEKDFSRAHKPNSTLFLNKAPTLYFVQLEKNGGFWVLHLL